MILDENVKKVDFKIDSENRNSEFLRDSTDKSETDITQSLVDNENYDEDENDIANLHKKLNMLRKQLYGSNMSNLSESNVVELDQSENEVNRLGDNDGDDTSCILSSSSSSSTSASDKSSTIVIPNKSKNSIHIKSIDLKAKNLIEKRLIYYFITSQERFFV